jgi:hypothetical protein
MKHDLKRIESTLEQLQSQPKAAVAQAASASPNVSDASRSVSFRVETAKSEPPSMKSIGSPIDLEEVSQFPSLPIVNSPTFTTHRSTANPTLAMNLLREMEGVVSGWQVGLQTLMQQVQTLYQEGPIIAGWLESYTQEEAAMLNLRHADVECLLSYVEKRWSTELSGETPPGSTTPDRTDAAAGYRLCGLTEDGQAWFRHCPAEQVPAVSLAIARYQRLRQLLEQKQEIERQLSQFAETLIEVRSHLQA